MGVAELAEWSEAMRRIGPIAAGAGIDWPGLMRFKRTFTDPVPADREKGYADAGIAMFHGRCKFAGPNTIEVDGQRLTAGHIAIAAGAAPAKMGIPGEELLASSEQFLELPSLPRRIVFVGGGYISFEFAYVAHAAGSEVTILHRGKRPLAGFDPGLVDSLVEATRSLGIVVNLGSAVESVERADEGFIVASGGRKFEADLVVHGAGRAADIADMELERGGVACSAKGVTVNEYLQSVSNPVVYAAGDAAATAGLPLTPIAALEGAAVAANLLQGNREKPDYSGMSTVSSRCRRWPRWGCARKKRENRDCDFR